ncbi:MAG: hypothetical protein ACLFUO_01040, partial [Candidatus Woesearchaeota archaeon]
QNILIKNQNNLFINFVFNHLHVTTFCGGCPNLSRLFKPISIKETSSHIKNFIKKSRFFKVKPRLAQWLERSAVDIASRLNGGLRD